MRKIVFFICIIHFFFVILQRLLVQKGIFFKILYNGKE